MRRLLALALLASSALAPAAFADPCGDPETDDCHPYDCIAWDPVGALPQAVDEALAGNVTYAVALLLPPPCPPA